ncbi:MAG: universal stress protein [Rhodocyclaceae bacterium]|jgi:nucleotide-binding universal stress UspA family protein|nr:universal stress protein [Rhodocyclaceae bacterium]MCL4759666.1 universal stress protein [Rhodocyclaceae bacterium]
MYRHVFVAIDDSATSQKALEEAITVARIHGAELEIAHAIDEQLVHVFHAGGVTTTSASQLKNVLVSSGEEVLTRAVEHARTAGVQARAHLIKGHGKHADDLIADAVQSSGADLLVVGSHGRRGVRRLLLGSVAENLVRKVGISVLIVRGMPAGERSTD